MKLSPHEIAWLVVKRWDDPAQQRIAVAVALAESDGDTDAIGRSVTGDNTGQRDHGLWQISGRWHGEKLQASPDWRDPEVNADLALAVWKGRRNWKPWAVFNSGAYEKYLPDADHALAAPFPPPARPATVAQVGAAAATLAEMLVEITAVHGGVGDIRKHFAQEG